MPRRHQGLAVIDALVMELRGIQHIVHMKAIGVADAVRCHFFSNDGDQGLALALRMIAVYTLVFRRVSSIPLFRLRTRSLWVGVPLHRSACLL